jgi:hypothetical protein
MKFFKAAAVLVCVVAAFSINAFGQDARIQLGNLDRLEGQASEVVNVTLDERLLRLAAGFLSSKDPDQAKVKELVSGLKGVYVKSFQFEKENEFTKDDVRSITSQLTGSRWAPMVNVRSKKQGQILDVYTMFDGANRMEGVTVVAVEPKQLTVVNIVGVIDLEKLSSLSGSFGIPKIEIEQNPKRVQ